MDTPKNAKLPPQNPEAEQATLGSILIDRHSMDRIADIVRPEDFYQPANATIFTAMLDLYEKNEPIDLLTVTSRLEDRGQLESIGGRTYLTSLTNVVPTASNVVQYATTVQRKATLRRLIQTANDIASFGYQEDEDIDILLDKAEQSVFGVSQKYLKQRFISIKSVLPEVFDRIDELHREAGKLRGVATGFTDLDLLLAGLQKSDLIILAARPSVGKTSLALDIARQVAVHAKQPVGIFSLEMSKDQLIDRMLCGQANVGLWKMRTGRLTDDEDFSSIGNAMGVLSEAPIFIDDAGSANIMEVRTKARRLQSEHGLGLIVLDYLQLMEGRTATDNRVQEVAEITRSLKGLARELNVPILALSQLSRAVESRTPPIPKLADLRESGSIEQDADVVMFIYREALYKQVDGDRTHIAEIQIAKHRNGPTGKVELFFDEQSVSFKNLERRRGGDAGLAP
ncbi:MAG: replicative DNA helicase [Candidatus Kerfeldbacteria bacterium]|nr:replicative DNA helicase [Candidatus Kerfeldbacteria bacterium]